jgi:prepilin-type N-terminal cleavage/methylation domain-containing protein
MNQWASKQKGFTIVELLIVVVVIAILAAITIVSYNGIRERAVTSQVQSALSQANKSVNAYAITNMSNYPETLEAAGVPTSGSVTLQYTYDNTVTPRTYEITASNGVTGSIVYYLSSTQSTMVSGIAPGHNLLAWSEPSASTAPVMPSSGVAIDTTTFKSAPASTRLGPGATARSLRANPYTGQIGQRVTVSFSIKSDANWDGLSNNSKVRFVDSGGAGLQKTCPYEGVKLDWTQFSCYFAFNATTQSVNITLGNDGATGSIWFDDISVSVK